MNFMRYEFISIIFSKYRYLRPINVQKRLVFCTIKVRPLSCGVMLQPLFAPLGGLEASREILA